MPRLSRRLHSALAAGLLALLGACAVSPPTPTPPSAALPAAPAAPPEPAATAAAPPGDDKPGPALLRTQARWVPVAWSALPGWGADRASELWPALRASCARPAPAWVAVCSRVAQFTPPDDGFAQDFLQRELAPYRVESLAGEALGLATGYFEPLVAASRQRRPGFTIALHKPPADLAQRKPYWTRQQLDTLPEAIARLRGQEIAWLASALDLLVLQIQGSGRLRISEPDGRQRTVRVAYAGHNDQPYKSVGRWLIEQGELRTEQASWPGIKAWAQRNPKRVNELLWSNPRYVFFREEPLPDPPVGPKGAQGVALTPGRAIAVDPQSIPYGTPVWLDSTEPLSETKLRRLAMAQDTGSAITGAVRADYFWGWGEDAETQAGRMKQPLRMWALWPKP